VNDFCPLLFFCALMLFFDSATKRREEVVAGKLLKTEPAEADGSNRYLVIFARASQSTFSDFT
jgi:hypothetical protein